MVNVLRETIPDIGQTEILLVPVENQSRNLGSWKVMGPISVSGFEKIVLDNEFEELLICDRFTILLLQRDMTKL